MEATVSCSTASYNYRYSDLSQVNTTSGGVPALLLWACPATTTTEKYLASVWLPPFCAGAGSPTGNDRFGYCLHRHRLDNLS